MYIYGGREGGKGRGERVVGYSHTYPSKECSVIVCVVVVVVVGGGVGEAAGRICVKYEYMCVSGVVSVYVEGGGGRTREGEERGECVFMVVV